MVNNEKILKATREAFEKAKEEGDRGKMMMLDLWHWFFTNGEMLMDDETGEEGTGNGFPKMLEMVAWQTWITSDFLKKLTRE